MILTSTELIAINRPLHFDRLDFYLLCHGFGGKDQREIATNFSFEPFQENHSIEPRGTFSLHGDRAQALIDQLWQCGLRPSQGKQSEGVTAAQARHLEDMRAIAFDRLKVERP